MKIEHLTLGPYETNCYVLSDGDAARDCDALSAGEVHVGVVIHINDVTGLSLFQGSQQRGRRPDKMVRLVFGHQVFVPPAASDRAARGIVLGPEGLLLLRRQRRRTKGRDDCQREA